VIVERGAHATRYSDVARASGVPIGTLQYYFGSRDELLVAALRHGSASDRQRLRNHLETLGSPWEKLNVMVDAQILAYDVTATPASLLYVEFFRLALRHPQVRDDVLAEYRGWRDLMAEVIAEGAAVGQFDPAVDPDRAALQVLSMLGGLVIPLALADPSIPVAGAREIMMSSVATLVGADPALPARVAPAPGPR
jgi:AcrR family transcriptional regulator